MNDNEVASKIEEIRERLEKAVAEAMIFDDNLGLVSSNQQKSFPCPWWPEADWQFMKRAHYYTAALLSQLDLQTKRAEEAERALAIVACPAVELDGRFQALTRQYSEASALVAAQAKEIARLNKRQLEFVTEKLAALDAQKKRLNESWCRFLVLGDDQVSRVLSLMQEIERLKADKLSDPVATPRDADGERGEYLASEVEMTDLCPFHDLGMEGARCECSRGTQPKTESVGERGERVDES